MTHKQSAGIYFGDVRDEHRLDTPRLLQHLPEFKKKVAIRKVIPK